MPQSQFENVEGDKLSEYEVSKLRHLAPSVAETWDADSIRVRDVAEATGLAEEKVRSELRTIRAEKALSSPPLRSRSPLLTLTAVGVLALGLAYVALHQPNDGPAYGKPLLIQTTPEVRNRSNVPFINRAPPRATLPPSQQFHQGDELPPAGFQIDVASASESFNGVDQDTTGLVPPMEYGSEVQSIVKATLALAHRAAASPESSQAATGPFQDMVGTTYTPKPGFFHYSISGWAGIKSGWISTKLDGTVRQQLVEVASDLFKKAKSEQDSALDLKVDPASVVLPPPGFTIDYYGRRFDHQEGPRISFVPLDPGIVRTRLELAIRSAIERDGKPPVGRWTVDQENDSKIPQPRESRVEIKGPGGSWSFDVPTGHGWDSTSSIAIRENLKKVDEQLAEVDRVSKP